MNPEIYALIGITIFVLWLIVRCCKLARERARENAILEIAQSSKAISKELKKQNEILSELIGTIRKTAPAEQDPQEQS